jgi:nicotinate-nucleotide pyrophosphorylase (carboxylating)
MFSGEISDKFDFYGIQMKDDIRRFILEDLGFNDITTEALIDKDIKGNAKVICKEEAILAGLVEASMVFSILGCTFKFLENEGVKVTPGTPIMNITGPAQSILKGERTALNLLMRMSGIATVTNRLSEKISNSHSKVKIACTRKTAPGLRLLDKKAVKIGGGDTHRFRLDDAMLIKTNHLRLVGSIKRAVEKARDRGSFTKKIEIEVETSSQAMKAAQAGVDIIMLDNLKPKEILEILRDLEEQGLRQKVLIEASGGINEENILEFAETGVDVISIGALTHSVNVIDMNLILEKA